MSYIYNGNSKHSALIKCPKCNTLHKIDAVREAIKDSPGESSEIKLEAEHSCDCGFKSSSISTEEYSKMLERVKSVKESDSGIRWLGWLLAIVSGVIWYNLYTTTPSLYFSISGGVAVFIVLAMPISILTIFLLIRTSRTNNANQLRMDYTNDALAVFQEEIDAEKQFNKTNNNITDRTKKVLVKSGEGFSDTPSYIWMDSKNLHLMTDVDSIPPIDFVYGLDNNLIMDYSISSQINKISIPLDSIEYFGVKGEVFRETKVSGGGGGGTSLTGAIIGGAIAGEAGAIIGSRRKVEEVTSELITHDSRETFLNYFVDGERYAIFFDFNDFQTLCDLLPNKEYSIVSAIKSKKAVEESDDSSSALNKIRKLSKLKDEGIISEDEFNEKKKDLLSKI